MKKIVFLLLLFISFSFFGKNLLFSQETDNQNQSMQEIFEQKKAPSLFRIDFVQYTITGKTKPEAAQNLVFIDKKRKFTEAELDNYLESIKKKFYNHRFYDTVTIEKNFVLPEDKTENITLVDVNILLTESKSFIILPYPKYDSNSGFEIKVVVKNGNFIGTTYPFELDLAYTFNEKNTQHGLGGEINFSLPISWTPILSVFYFIGDIEWKIPLTNMYMTKEGINFISEVEGSGILSLIADIKAGIDFSYEHDRGSFDFGFSEMVTYNPDFKNTDDEFYTTFFAYVSNPFNVATILKEVDIFFAPGFYTEWIFTPAIREDLASSGVTREDLRSPRFAYYHTLSFESINWDNNFRNGYSLSYYQDFSYNFHSNFPDPLHLQRFNTVLQIEVQGFYNLSFMGFNGRMQIFYHFQDYTETKFGQYMRGIPDYKAGRGQRYYAFNSGIVFNFDFPIKLFTTDLAKWNAPQWLHIFDIEMQISPTIDIAFGKNKNEFSYSFRDGFYTIGIEALVFPLKIKSIQARAGIAFDISSFIDKKYINKDFRLASVWEAFIGFGLLY
ncbi:MAG: hypothetical protein ACRC5H_03120 [Treponemataceae bacterium]